MTDEAKFVSGVELARSFYVFHELEFEKAARQPTTEERGFDYTADRFDDWAVQHELMAKRLRDAVDLVESRGLSQIRSKLRDRLNRAARKGDGLTRAFSVEGRAQKWRVDLSERWVSDRPQNIIRGIGGVLELSEKRIEQTFQLLAGNEFLDPEESTVLTAQLAMAQMFIMSNLQLVELIATQAATGKRPDMRRIRQRMAKAWNAEQKAAAKSKPVRAKRRAPPRSTDTTSRHG